MWHRFMWIIASWLLLTASIGDRSTASADEAGDAKRAALQKVHRVVIVPPFFGTDTLGELPPRTDKSGRQELADTPIDEKARERRNEYIEVLKKLEIHARETLPTRLAARTPFVITPGADTVHILEALKKAPPAVFKNGGRIMGKKFDQPDTETVLKIATEAKADAVLLCAFDEPRRNSGGYYFDPLSGPGYDVPKVHDKATFDLITLDGNAVIHQTVEVVHPVTKLGQRLFLLADWTETVDQIIEDFMDELTRYTPHVKGK